MVKSKSFNESVNRRMKEKTQHSEMLGTNFQLTLSVFSIRWMDYSALTHHRLFTTHGSTKNKGRECSKVFHSRHLMIVGLFTLIRKTILHTKFQWRISGDLKVFSIL